MSIIAAQAHPYWWLQAMRWREEELQKARGKGGLTPYEEKERAELHHFLMNRRPSNG
jgi:hypothetical protein